MTSLDDELVSCVKRLNDTVWDGSINNIVVDDWLRGFGPDGAPGTNSRTHALYLLSRFMYFGDYEVRGLLRSLFRDCYEYPIIAAAREGANDTTDQLYLEQALDLAKTCTRFLGIGNPSESGTHLLYHYRQENDLSKHAFINSDEVFQVDSNSQVLLRDPTVTRYIFIDDFCGSGEQASIYGPPLNDKIRRAAAASGGVSVHLEYHVMIGTDRGLSRVQGLGIFDDVKFAMKLDDTYRAFDATSRYFTNAPKGIAKSTAEALAFFFGTQLIGRRFAFGFGNGQLLIGFFHNTPDNTLPIFWYPGRDDFAWYPVFRRYQKF